MLVWVISVYTRYLLMLKIHMKLGKYIHYKWKEYEVLWVARHSETLEELVVYRALYESEEFWSNAMWVRPKSMFIENVTINWKELKRFKYVW